MLVAEGCGSRRCVGWWRGRVAASERCHHYHPRLARDGAEGARVSPTVAAVQHGGHVMWVEVRTKDHDEAGRHYEPEVGA